MKNFSVSKFSVLGLVLMSASAVTAAVMSGHQNRNTIRIEGSLTMDNGRTSGVSCTASDGPSQPSNACNASTGGDTNTTNTENASNDTWSGAGGNTSEGGSRRKL